jgi:hypothetical protein
MLFEECHFTENTNLSRQGLYYISIIYIFNEQTYKEIFRFR